MTQPDAEDPFAHGYTVLPGVPLPPSAHPHAPAAPPPPAPEPAPSAAAPGDAPAPAEGPSAAPAKTPWWKREIGAKGTKDAPAEAPVEAPAAPASAAPAEAPIEAPTAPPAAAPHLPTTPPPPSSAALPLPPPAEVGAGTTPAPVQGRHAAPAPAAGRSRVLVLAAIGLVVVLAAVAAFVWPGFLVSSSDAESGAAPRPTPSASTATVTLATPAKIDGLRRFTGAADKSLAASVAKSAVEGLSDPVSAVYGKGTTPVAQVIAWKAVSPPAADTVTAAFTGYEGSTGAKVTAVREVKTPGLGGHMECGLATLRTVKTLQCFWADDASVGSVTVLAVTDRAEATSTARAIRTAVEQTD